MDAPIITDAQVAAINAARTALDEIERQNFNLVDLRKLAVEDPYAVHARGRMASLADVAESALFDVLNSAVSYAHVDLTEEQTHNR